MNTVTKIIICTLALSVNASPVFAKGGRSGHGSFKSSSHKINPSTPKPTTQNATPSNEKPKVNYRFGNSSGSSEPCRYHGGVSHCNTEGKYVCKDNTVSLSSKTCRYNKSTKT